jgi:hypothetical protein
MNKPARRERGHQFLPRTWPFRASLAWIERIARPFPTSSLAAPAVPLFRQARAACETQLADGQWYSLQLIAQVKSASVIRLGQLLALKSSTVFLGSAVRVTWTIGPPGTGATFTFSRKDMGR